MYPFSEKRPELDGEVFEVLETFTEFLAFKEMFLDYRAVSIYEFYVIFSICLF